MRYGRHKRCIMFVDETGVTDITDTNSVFGLIGVIFKSNEINNYESEFYKQLQQLKQECFEDKFITLHLTDIIRKRSDFKCMKVSQIQKFIDNIDSFINGLNIEIISITVNKQSLQKYTEDLKDIYEIAFAHLLESYYLHIKKYDIKSAKIVIEQRDDFENFLVQNTFFKVFNNGTTYFNINDELRSRIKGFILAPKGDEKYGCGLEIADILCNPISRIRVGYSNELSNSSLIEHRNNTIFNAVKNKIFNIDNDLLNWGFRFIPIREKDNIASFEKNIKPKDIEIDKNK